MLERSSCQNSNEDDLPLNNSESWALDQNKSPGFRFTSYKRQILRENELKYQQGSPQPQL